MSRLGIDREARTIYGRAIPWNTVSIVNHRRIALFADCLTWPESLHLLLRHDHSLITGKVISLESASDGLYALFSVRSGPRGEQALAFAEAGWGLSCGFDLLEYDNSGNAAYCTRGEITEISLVPKPAFP